MQTLRFYFLTNRTQAMDNMQVKFEHSPTTSIEDSFVSTPDSHYPSLFQHSELLTPPHIDDDASIFSQSRSQSVVGDPESSTKKPVKKRKSWGQQLPEPKTNLPPRKRAKTEDEKEQRRVERVLRNRRAAQSSRERKRLEVEALENEKQAIERRNYDLELRLADMEAKNLLLQQQIAQLTGNMTVFNQPPIATQRVSETSTLSCSDTSPTFSQELFSSRDTTAQPQIPLPSQSLLQPPSLCRTGTGTGTTIDPAAISPAVSPSVRPVADPRDPSNANSVLPDLTQLPAAKLCDLQCQSDGHRPWMGSPMGVTRAPRSQFRTAISNMMMAQLAILSSTSPFLTALAQIFHSLKVGSSLCPSTTDNSTITTLICLLTFPLPLRLSTRKTTTKTSTSATFSSRKRWTRTLLRRLLACSPQLARPLWTATLGLLRCVVEGERGVVSSPVGGVSRASLVGLLWSIKIISRELGNTVMGFERSRVGGERKANGLVGRRNADGVHVKGWLRVKQRRRS